MVIPSNTCSNTRSYKDLDTKDIINLAIDFIKVGHPYPVELKNRLEELNLLSLLNTLGDNNEAKDY